MFKKILSLGLLAIVIGFMPTVVPVQAKTSNSLGKVNAVETAKVARRFGPYATLRRANEVANYARRRGYRAKVIYGGSLYSYSSPRVYYVDVW
jgi:hypothetical protein